MFPRRTGGEFRKVGQKITWPCRPGKDKRHDASLFTSFKATHAGCYTEKGFGDHSAAGTLMRLFFFFYFVDCANQCSSKLPSMVADSATLAKLHLVDVETQAKSSE